MWKTHVHRSAARGCPIAPQRMSGPGRVVVELDWRYADKSGRANPLTNRTAINSADPPSFAAAHAGIVSASLPMWTHTALTVFGFMDYSHVRRVKASRNTAPDRARSSLLQCAVGQGEWVNATSLTELPASTTDLHAFKEAYGGVRVVGRPTDDIHGVRFSCIFGPDKLISPGTLARFRMKAADGISIAWAVNDVVVRCPGYPIVSAELNGTKCSSVGPSAQEVASRVSITACLTNLYGVGYDVRVVAEYAAWYLLLGATRVVIFESIEPDVQERLFGERGGKRAQLAQRNMQMLHAMARRMPRRVHIIRGLVGWEMMRRTANHDHGQTLAGNMCKAAARDLAMGRPHGRPLDGLRYTPSDGTASAHGQGLQVTPYVMQMDVDEFLVPPTTAWPELQSQLTGSLLRTAQQLQTGAPASALFLNDTAMTRSRVETFKEGIGRCLLFADVYYLLPDCNTSASPNSTEILATSLSRHARRGQSDKFEEGPSLSWKILRGWNFIVRSKYITTADDETLMGVHECCCNKVVHGTCFSVPRRGSDRAPCASMESMPVELWESRHLKHGFQSTSQCTRSRGFQAALVSQSNPRGRWVTLPGTHNPIPTEWAAQIAVEVDRTLRGRSYL